MAEKKAFLFVMRGKRAQILKSLTSDEATNYRVTESMRQGQKAWISDFTGATDAHIRDIRAQFDPSYPGYTGQPIIDVRQAPLPLVAKSKQMSDSKSGPIDFSRLNDKQKGVVRHLFQTSQHRELRQKLKKWKAAPGLCGTCNIRDWMLAAIDRGLI